MKKSRMCAALVLHLYIVISMLICLLRFLTASGDGNMQVHGGKAFQFFTVDSNALMAIVSIFCIIGIIRLWKDPTRKSSDRLMLFQYIATAAVAVTFVTVCVILLPATSLEAMFSGSNFMMHLINPLAAIACFMFFSPGGRISWKQSPLAIITTIIYGILYFIMVVAIGKENGGWDDFYMFNTNSRWYISFIVMQIIAYLIGLGLRAVHNRFVPADHQNHHEKEKKYHDSVRRNA